MIQLQSGYRNEQVFLAGGASQTRTVGTRSLIAAAAVRPSADKATDGTKDAAKAFEPAQLLVRGDLNDPDGADIPTGPRAAERLSAVKARPESVRKFLEGRNSFPVTASMVFEATNPYHP